jgi:6-phosphogluconolactonase
MKTWLLICLVSACVLATLRGVNAAEGDYLLYVGSYTDKPSTSKGIYAWRFEPSSGNVTPLGLVAETINPAYVSATPDGRFLYAVNRRPRRRKTIPSAPMRSTGSPGHHANKPTPEAGCRIK